MHLSPTRPAGFWLTLLTILLLANQFDGEVQTLLFEKNVVDSNNRPSTIVNDLTGKKGRSRNRDSEPLPQHDFMEASEPKPAYDPHSPLVQCNFLPLEFLECDEPVDLEGNQTAFEVNGFGCYRYGGQRWEDVQTTAVKCTVLPGIECYGSKSVQRDGFPCVKFTGHYFLSTLLYSVLLGFVAVDRFCLGHTCIGIGKILTVGGLGVWWFVDIILLITGHLLPEDGSNWMPYY